MAESPRFYIMGISTYCFDEWRFLCQPTDPNQEKREQKMTDELKIINTSPTPLTTLLSISMNFAEAILAIQYGKKVTKLEWNDPKIIVSIIGGLLQITLPKNDYAPCPLTVSQGDITGTDWISVE